MSVKKIKENEVLVFFQILHAKKEFSLFYKFLKLLSFFLLKTKTKKCAMMKIIHLGTFNHAQKPKILIEMLKTTKCEE